MATVCSYLASSSLTRHYPNLIPLLVTLPTTLTTTRSPRPHLLTLKLAATGSGCGFVFKTSDNESLPDRYVPRRFEEDLGPVWHRSDSVLTFLLTAVQPCKPLYSLRASTSRLLCFLLFAFIFWPYVFSGPMLLLQEARTHRDTMPDESRSR